MRLLLLAALAIALAAPAYAQPDGASKAAPATCHSKAVKCAPAKPHRKKGGSQEGMKAQSFTQCRDVRTHTPTKCGGPYAEPLPAN